MFKSKVDRVYISCFLLVVIVCGFFLRLVQFQVVEADHYKDIARKSLAYTNKIEPTRGGILDRNGEYLATSRMSFNIELNRAFLPKSKDEEIILNLSNTLSKYNTPWIDNLYIDIVNGEFQFTEDKEDNIEKIKRNLKLNTYATAENVMIKLIEDYDLQEYTKEQQRTLAGVKYEMKQKQFSNATPYIFAEDISLELVTFIKENSFDLKGVEIAVIPVRHYTDSTLASHVMGTIGPITAEDFDQLKTKGYGYNDIVGIYGIEKLFEDTLRGESGAKEVLRNDSGDIIDVAVTKDPVPGDSVVLTIDKNLQKTTEKLLEKYIKKFNAERKLGDGGDASSGAVAVINTKTGEILSLVSYPNYDINLYKENYGSLLKDENKPLFNRALQGTYNPGSIYKPVMVAVGQKSGVISNNYTVNCKQVYDRFSGYRPRCLGYHGNISVYNAMAVSCNIFFYEIGYLSGIEIINEISNKLGAGVSTGIELTENIGQISSPKLREKRGQKWYPGDVVQAAIGQSDTMLTPLQMAVYTAAIANKGVRNKATIVKDIIDYKGDVVQKQKPIEILDTFEGENVDFEIIKKSMLQTTLTGSGRLAFGNYPFQVGTKTGTPQAPSGSNNGSFIAFGPYDDPEIAVAAIVEHGGEGYYVSPMVREIFDAYFFDKHILE
ncbi:MAG: penicillin-binding transpeptidase domain-containing protein [Oscillospiraceae bacterium]